MSQKFCDKFFDKHVITPEQATDGCCGVPSHKVQDGNLVSLAETDHKILNNKDYVHGAVSNTSRKKRDASKLINESRFILRKKDACDHLIRVTMEADGFEKGKHMGLRAHHNFVADLEIPGYTFMSRRVPNHVSWL